MNPTPKLLTFLLGSSLLAAVSTTNAQSTWTGDTINNTDISWGTASNWSPATVPGTAIFTSASASGHSIVLGDANRTATITFDSTTGSIPYTINLFDADLTTRRVLNVGGVTVEAGNHTFMGAKPSGVAGDFRPQNNAVFDIATGTSLDLDVRLRHGATNHVYSKTGDGTLILSANNGGSNAWQFNQGAGFAIQNGVLRFAAAAASGHTGNRYIVSSGAAIELSASFGSINAPQTISGNGINNTGAIRSLGGNLTFGTTTTTTGSLTLAANSSVGVDTGSLEIGFAIGESGGAHSFTKVGDGTLTLSNANTFTGSTTVSAGTLLINGSLGNSPVTVDPLATLGGTGSIGGSLTVAANSFLQIVDIDNPLAVTGTITLGSGFGIANLLGIDWDLLALGTEHTVISTTQTFGSGDIANFGFDNRIAVGNSDREAYFVNGSLAVVVIPEPTTPLLCTLGLLALLRRRR